MPPYRGPARGRGSARPAHSDTQSQPQRPADSNDRATLNQNPINRKATPAAVKPDINTSAANSANTKEEVASVPILILGAQGCGKSSFINATLPKPVHKISDGYEPATKDFCSASVRAGNYDFTLIDSPGLDNTSMSDTEVFTKLIKFLCGKPPAMIAGVIYLHAQDSRLGSGALAKNLSFIKHILGDSFLGRLTIVVVPRLGEQADHQKLVDPLLHPKSPFYALYSSGAQPDVSALETQSISKILLPYAKKAPTLMSVQNELCKEERPLTGDAINSYINRYTRTREGGPEAPRRSIVSGAFSLIRTQNASSAQNKFVELKKTQPEQQEPKKQTEDSTQVQQHLDQYSDLFSQLQIHENLEQKDIVQSLIDLNRHIDDFALSVSLHLTDTYGGPNITTTRQAFHLPELKQLFGHEEGKASLVQSSKGEGMPLEDFLDVAIRSILCEQLYKRIFGPFHPGIELVDPRNGYITALYTQIRETENQATLGRWRTASFNAITGLTGEQGLSRLKEKAKHGILHDRLMPMLKHLFGPKKNACLKDAQLKDLSELVTQAWDWCLMLKEKVVLLGDFRLAAYRYGQAFDPALMTEFEPRKGAPPPDRILSTIGLGMNVDQSTGGRLDRVILCKASVVTEGWYERS